MPLSSYNINQRLATHLEDLFTQKHSFEALKTYLVEQQPISVIQQKIVVDIVKHSDEDKAAVKISLEQEALKEQRQEDETAQQQDDEIKQQLSIAPEELVAELSEKQKLIALRETELAELNQRVASNLRWTIDMSDVGVKEHPVQVHSDETQTSESVSAVVINANNPLYTQRVASLQEELTQLKARTLEIENTLNQSQQQVQQLKVNDLARQQRLKAGLNWENAKANVSIYQALSEKNQEALKNKLHEAYLGIDNHAIELEQQAEEHNYNQFFTAVKTELKDLEDLEPDVLPKIEAIESIIRHIEIHREKRATLPLLQQKLDEINNTISTNKTNLDTYQERVKFLELNIPGLSQKNTDLVEQNKKLKPSMERNKNAALRALIPSVTTGIIGVGLITSLLLLPFAFPLTMFIFPALVVLTGLGFGIASLVYHLKGKHDSNAIAANEQSIAYNELEKHSNQQELDQLSTQTIPTSQKAIQEAQEEKELTEQLLQKTELQAHDALEIANAIEPIEAKSKCQPELIEETVITPPEKTTVQQETAESVATVELGKVEPETPVIAEKSTDAIVVNPATCGETMFGRRYRGSATEQFEKTFARFQNEETAHCP